jgi:hypothetical protein
LGKRKVGGGEVVSGAKGRGREGKKIMDAELRIPKRKERRATCPVGQSDSSNVG